MVILSAPAFSSFFECQLQSRTYCASWHLPNSNAEIVGFTGKPKSANKQKKMNMNMSKITFRAQNSNLSFEKLTRNLFLFNGQCSLQEQKRGFSQVENILSGRQMKTNVERMGHYSSSICSVTRDSGNVTRDNDNGNSNLGSGRGRERDTRQGTRAAMEGGERSSVESTNGQNVFNISPTRLFAVVRLMRVNQGGAFLDVLVGEGEASWREEKLYVERSLGFKTMPVDARQLRQVTDLVAGAVRWQRYLDYLISQYFHGEQRDLERMEPLLLQIIRLGLYEIVKCDHPSYAVINEMVEIAKAALRPGAGNLVNAMLRRAAKDKEGESLPEPIVEGNERSRARALATIHSHPVWLVRRWLTRFGEEEAVRFLQWNNQRPFFSLRANSGKSVSRDLLLEKLSDLKLIDIEPSPYLEDFVRIRTGMQDVLYSGLLRDGSCNVQDESAGLVVALLDPQPGETLIDCCAAPGGKTLFAAARMKGIGKILAVDSNKGRALLVRQAAERQGMEKLVETISADIRHVAEKGEIQADRVLLDTPCSGLGVLSKRADLRWRRTLEDMEDLMQLQDDLLDAASRLVKPGGLLVYSTCSIEKDENGDRVTAFCKRNPEFEIETASGFVPENMLTSEGYFASLPHRDNIDGAFACRLRRRERKE